MVSRDDYLIGWICALPVEVAAARATLDCIHESLPVNPDLEHDDNNYILGTLQGHNVVLAYPSFGVYGKTSVAAVATQLHASFRSIRFNLVVGIAGGVPDTKEDVHLGDVVVSKSVAGQRGIVQYNVNEGWPRCQPVSIEASGQPASSLLSAIGKAETAAIFDESQMPQYISEIMLKDPVSFAHPGLEQDILYELDHNHIAIEFDKNESSHGRKPYSVRPRRPRETRGSVVHYGLIASGYNLMRHGAIWDNIPFNQDVLCLDSETVDLRNAAQYLIIRGVCDYADSHSSDLWHGYAAAAAAAYAREVLSFVPTAVKTITLATETYSNAASVLDALLLTRPEVDRKSLIALKGHRVDGTCEWLMQQPRYQEWLANVDPPLLWISGGPGKGKTMLAIYITEVLQPLVDADENVLLYYFCSNRDKNRNTALTIMRGIIHQWIRLHPHLAQYVKAFFEGTETTKYTVSSFVSLWRVFIILLRQSKSSQVVCVLDGLDECENESLKQLLDAVRDELSTFQGNSTSRLKFILLSRPQPVILESKLDRYPRIKLEDSGTNISRDVERYIFAKVAELASEQNLSKERVLQVRQAMLVGAEGTFLWVAFVANELEGKSWDKITEILHRVPKGLGGIYFRLLQQIDEKEMLVPILQWIVLAARPLTLDELTAATEIRASGDLSPTEVIKNRLRLCGLLVKMENSVVNLVHESAKEFFQSDQINVKETSMFRMNQYTHRALLRTCLAHLERGYGTAKEVNEGSSHDPLLAYASQYWPLHFHHAIDVIEAPSDFARPFFQANSSIRDRWWKFFWEQEKNGGQPPSFTLLHLAAYLGNTAWAKLLIDEHAHLISRKDNYGRTPLSWAVNRGHRDMVKLLLDHGAHVNAKDRSKLTALHVAASGQHKDIVSLLIDQGAHLESKSEHGETALIRAIQANAREIIQMLLEHGARVSKLPTPPGVTSLKGPADPMEERVDELLGLQDQILLAQYEDASRHLDGVLKVLTLSFRAPVILQFVTLYLKFVAFDRWERLSVLQELVRANKKDELLKWAAGYREFFVQLVVARKARRLTMMTDLATQVFRAVAPGDLQALLVIAILIGSETKLAAVRSGWNEGDAILARVFSHWAAIAYSRDAEEFLHYGVREFFNDFDACIQSGNREENVTRAVVVLTSHFAMLENKKPQPVKYFAKVVAEFYEGYIGGPHEVELFNDANQACVSELLVINENSNYPRLLLFMTSIFQFAQRCQEEGQDRFLNMPSASCSILCQQDAAALRWLIGEAIPRSMCALISEQASGPLQKRSCKALVECLIIGKQYDLSLPAAELIRVVKQHLHSLPEVENMIRQIGRS